MPETHETQPDATPDDTKRATPEQATDNKDDATRGETRNQGHDAQ